MVIVRRHGKQAGGFQRTGGLFENPVAAKRGGAGGVGGRGHVGARELREPIDEGSAILAGGHIATVEQQVGTGRQRGTPGSKLLAIVVEIGLAQAGYAQAQRRFVAMAQHMDGLQILVSLEPGGDLIDAVLICVEHDNFDASRCRLTRPGLQRHSHEGGIILDLRVDENDFVGVGRRGLRPGGAEVLHREHLTGKLRRGNLDRRGERRFLGRRRRRQNQSLAGEQKARLHRLDVQQPRASGCHATARRRHFKECTQTLRDIGSVLDEVVFDHVSLLMRDFNVFHCVTHSFFNKAPRSSRSARLKVPTDCLSRRRLTR